MSLVTVNNLYENGVCDEFTIYTGTTYNGDPYIIPVSAQSIGSHSLPHTFDVGTYEGPLYIFLVHCDFYVTPPPSETPKRQGGFQVKLINIDCENCPPFSPVATPSPTSTPNATPTTDCNFTVNFVEYSPQPTPQPTPDATPNATPQPTPDATPQPTPNPSATPNSTPNPSPSPTEGPCVCIEFSHNSTGTRYYGYDDCSGVPQTGTTYTQETFSVCGSGQNITVSDPKLSYSIGSDCVEGICPSPNDPTPTPTPSPSSTPNPTASPSPSPSPSATPNCDFDVDINIAGPTATPTPSPSPSATPNCDFDVDINIATPTPTPSNSPTPTAEPLTGPDCGGIEEGDQVQGVYWEWDIVSQNIGDMLYEGSYFDHGMDVGWEFPNGIQHYMMFMVEGGSDGINNLPNEQYTLFTSEGTGSGKIYGKPTNVGAGGNNGTAAENCPIGGTITISEGRSSEGDTVLRKVSQLLYAPAPQWWVTRADLYQGFDGENYNFLRGHAYQWGSYPSLPGDNGNGQYWRMEMGTITDPVTGEVHASNIKGMHPIGTDKDAFEAIVNPNDDKAVIIIDATSASGIDSCDPNAITDPS